MAVQNSKREGGRKLFPLRQEYFGWVGVNQAKIIVSAVVANIALIVYDRNG